MKLPITRLGAEIPGRGIAIERITKLDYEYRLDNAAELALAFWCTHPKTAWEDTVGEAFSIAIASKDAIVWTFSGWIEQVSVDCSRTHQSRKVFLTVKSRLAHLDRLRPYRDFNCSTAPEVIRGLLYRAFPDIAVNTELTAQYPLTDWSFLSETDFSNLKQILSASGIWLLEDTRHGFLMGDHNQAFHKFSSFLNTDHIPEYTITTQRIPAKIHGFFYEKNTGKTTTRSHCTGPTYGPSPIGESAIAFVTNHHDDDNERLRHVIHAFEKNSWTIEFLIDEWQIRAGHRFQTDNTIDGITNFLSIKESMHLEATAPAHGRSRLLNFERRITAIPAAHRYVPDLTAHPAALASAWVSDQSSLDTHGHYAVNAYPHLNSRGIALRSMTPYAGSAHQGQSTGLHVPFSHRDELVVGALFGAEVPSIILGGFHSAQAPPPLASHKDSTVVVATDKGAALSLDAEPEGALTLSASNLADLTIAKRHQSLHLRAHQGHGAIDSQCDVLMSSEGDHLIESDELRLSCEEASKIHCENDVKLIGKKTHLSSTHMTLTASDFQIQCEEDQTLSIHQAEIKGQRVQILAENNLKLNGSILEMHGFRSGTLHSQSAQINMGTAGIQFKGRALKLNATVICFGQVFPLIPGLPPPLNPMRLHQPDDIHAVLQGRHKLTLQMRYINQLPLAGVGIRLRSETGKTYFSHCDREGYVHFYVNPNWSAHFHIDDFEYLCADNGQPCPRMDITLDTHKSQTRQRINVIPPPIIVSLRSAHQNSLSYPPILSAQMIRYLEHSGNKALIFIHGFNVLFGDFGFYDGTSYAATLRSENVRGGRGACKWLIEMEYNINCALGFNGADYSRYRRIVFVTWDGDPTHDFDIDTINTARNAIRFSAAEAAADRAAPQLAQLLKQMSDHQITTNIIAHSLGNRVVSQALKLLALRKQKVNCECYVLWQAAIPDNCFAPQCDFDTPNYVPALEAAERFLVLHSERDRSALALGYGWGAPISRFGNLYQRTYMADAMGISGPTKNTLMLDYRVFTRDLTPYLKHTYDDHSYMIEHNSELVAEVFYQAIFNNPNGIRKFGGDEG